MARRGSTGELLVQFAPTLSSMSAPTVAQAQTAGTNLSPFLTRDGLATPNSANTIDISDLADRRNKRAPGTFGGDDWTLTLYRDDADDDAWDLLEQDLDGYIIIRRFGGSNVALTAADPVEVAKVSVSSRVMDTPGADTPQTFTVVLAVAEQNDNAAIAA